jgi:hypothetical protein
MLRYIVARVRNQHVQEVLGVILVQLLVQDVAVHGMLLAVIAILSTLA